MLSALFFIPVKVFEQRSWKTQQVVSAGLDLSSADTWIKCSSSTQLCQLYSSLQFFFPEGFSARAQWLMPSQLRLTLLSSAVSLCPVIQRSVRMGSGYEYRWRRDCCEISILLSLPHTVSPQLSFPIKDKIPLKKSCQWTKILIFLLFCRFSTLWKFSHTML